LFFFFCKANITRTKEEALAKIQEYRNAIVSGATDLATLAKTESDCSSAAKGGDLGVFGRRQMQRMPLSLFFLSRFSLLLYYHFLDFI